MDRPKRRRYKDNPYFLLYDKDENKYYILFKDGQGIVNNVEVSFAIYDVFNSFELKDLSELNEYDNHIEHLDLDEETIFLRSKDKPIQLDDEIIKKSTYEELINAINKLPLVQCRRIKKYYFYEKTQQEIADEERVDIRAVQYSLADGLKKLKEILK